MSFLTQEELAELMPAEMLPHTTPIPTADYLRNGAARSNLRYGYVRKGAAQVG